jgi:hypothetical protein
MVRDERRSAADDYFHNFLLKVTRATPDDGELILILQGQREEWENSPLPYAEDRAALLRMALLLIEARKRASLSIMQAAVDACPIFPDVDNLQEAFS